MKAYLLAAGYATRLYPLTKDRAKPLLEVGGKALLTHILERITPLAGLSEVAVVGNTKFAGQLEAWAANVDCPVPVRVLDDGSTQEGDRLGAVGDIAFALEHVPPAGEDIVVVAGDNLLGFDLAPAQAAFLAARRPTILVRRLERDGPSAYNEVTLGENDGVTGFREKPPDPGTPWAAICLYFWPPEVEALLREYLAGGGNPDAPGHFIEWLVRRTEVVAQRTDGAWFDIGSHEALVEARARFGG